MIHIYGIKNCNTMKKAFNWLDENGVSYTFHDYKKEGADVAALDKAFAAHGWEAVINRRGTTWRKLDDAVKETMNETQARAQAIKNPSLIKRPLIVANDDIVLGFDESLFAQLK
jgi:arsenate reductase